MHNYNQPSGYIRRIRSTTCRSLAENRQRPTVLIICIALPRARARMRYGILKARCRRFLRLTPVACARILTFAIDASSYARRFCDFPIKLASCSERCFSVDARRPLRAAWIMNAHCTAEFATIVGRKKYVRTN